MIRLNDESYDTVMNALWSRRLDAEREIAVCAGIGARATTQGLAPTAADMADVISQYVERWVRAVRAAAAVRRLA